MNDSARRSWLGPAILVAAFYASIGIVSPAQAGASPDATRLWRWFAFLVSAIVFAGHIRYERVQLREPPRRTAWHTSMAVALGAFGLALAANLHDLWSATGYRPKMLIALFAWPLLTAVPAVFVAWLVALVVRPGRSSLPS